MQSLNCTQKQFNPNTKSEIKSSSLETAIDNISQTQKETNQSFLITQKPHEKMANTHSYHTNKKDNTVEKDEENQAVSQIKQTDTVLNNNNQNEIKPVNQIDTSLNTDLVHKRPKPEDVFFFKKLLLVTYSFFTEYLRFFKVLFYILPMVVKLYRKKLNTKNFTPDDLKKFIEKIGTSFIKMIQPFISHANFQNLFKLSLNANEEQVQAYMKVLSTFGSENKPMINNKLIDSLKKSHIPFDNDHIENRVSLGNGSIADVNLIKFKTDKDNTVKVVKTISESRIDSFQKDLNNTLQILTCYLYCAKIYNFIIKIKRKFSKNGTIATKDLSIMPNFSVYVLTNLIALIETHREECNLDIELNNLLTQKEAFQRISNNENSKKFHKKIEKNEVKRINHMLKNNIEMMGLEKDKISKVKDQINALMNNKITFCSPKVYPEYCSEKNLVLEQIHGSTLNESETRNQEFKKIIANILNIATNEVEDATIKLYKDFCRSLAYNHWFDCIVKTGFFQGDIHDGNLMIANEDGNIKIYFIDLGNAGQLKLQTHKALLSTQKKVDELRYQILFHTMKTRTHKNHLTIENITDKEKKSLHLLIKFLKPLFINGDNIITEELSNSILNHLILNQPMEKIKALSLQDIFELIYVEYPNLKIDLEISRLFKPCMVLSSIQNSSFESILIKRLKQYHDE